MSAAATLRRILDNTPPVEISADSFGAVTLWVGGEVFAVDRNSKELQALVLLNLLLAAAPPLSEWLTTMEETEDLRGMIPEPIQRIMDAMTEAHETL